MKARVEALQDEVMTTGEALKDAVVRNPFVVVGGAVAAGLVVGLLFGGRKRKGALDGAGAHRALLDGYVETLTAEVRRRVRRGADVGEAVQEALRDRAPLIVYAPEQGRSRRGIFGEFVIMALQTALGFGMKSAADYLTAKLDAMTVEEQVTITEEGGPGGGDEHRVTMTRTVTGPPEG